MATLIKNGQIVENTWLRLEEASDGSLPAVPQGQAVLVGCAVWQRHRDRLAVHQGGLGVVLTVDASLDEVGADLERFAVVALHIPKFGDGRALSLARLLRERYGYRGEVRAVGEVLHDQLADMRRCGFDAFDLRADQDPQAALGAFHPFSESYQASVDRPLPLFRRRAG
jgi:uncharacterized protein (DUF934 family)